MTMGGGGSNIVLIGLRGSGKSTLGARLAESLGRGFVDLDDVTAEVLGFDRAGAAIEARGMDAFRSAELVALEQELNIPERVIALGGGTPTAAGCSELLSGDRCRVIYLKARAAALRERLAVADNADRPSLTGGDVLEEIGAVYELRDPLYMELAESVVHTDGVGEDSVLAALIALAHAGK